MLATDPSWNNPQSFFTFDMDNVIIMIRYSNWFLGTVFQTSYSVTLCRQEQMSLIYIIMYKRASHRLSDVTTQLLV